VRETESKPRLLTLVRERVRFPHFALSTEKVYAHWIEPFIRFHSLRHPESMACDEVGVFLRIRRTSGWSQLRGIGRRCQHC